MKTQDQPRIVSGTLSSVSDLGHSEAWLQDWLAEDPSRLGLGALRTADKEPAQDDDGNPAFLAADDEHYFSVDVQLGEVDASHGFQVLDNWARNRVRHPDKTHVAVLVTETAGERYRTTLETLTEHLPLVVVELQVLRGEKEAILMPRIVLSSDELDFTPTEAITPAGQPASDESTTTEDATSDTADDGADEVTAEAETDATDDADEVIDKDDTGVDDPWQLPKGEAAETPAANGAGIISKEMLSNR